MKKSRVNNKDVYFIEDEEAHRMLDVAKKALVNTYPQSNKGYAAAVLTKNGTIYPGSSYCSDTYTLTMHGEAVALAHAALHGEKEIVAITGPNCHICKQLIYESSLRSGIDVVIILEEDGVIRQVQISKLMPYPWPEKPTI